MRAIARSGELATLAPERVWQELARGLMEAHPARMLAVLDDAGALAAVLPEVAAAHPSRSAKAPGRWMRLLRALDRAAAQDAPIEARYAVLAQDLASGADGPARARMRAADALSARLKVPTACRDAARLAARWLPRLGSIERLPPAGILDLLQSADALRRPERLAVLMQAWIAVDPAADGAGAAMACGAGRRPARRAARRRACALAAPTRFRRRFVRRGWGRCGNGSETARARAPMNPRQARLNAIRDRAHHVRGGAHQAPDRPGQRDGAGLHRHRAVTQSRHRASGRRPRGSSGRPPAAAPCARSGAPRPAAPFRRRSPGSHDRRPPPRRCRLRTSPRTTADSPATRGRRARRALPASMQDAPPPRAPRRRSVP